MQSRGPFDDNSMILTAKYILYLPMIVLRSPPPFEFAIHTSYKVGRVFIPFCHEISLA